MSDRGFFDRRDAIPGFTFILVILMYNYHPIFLLLKNNEISDLFGIIIGFLSIFSGSAIGFLISQFWWVYFQSRGGNYGWRGKNSAIDALIAKYHLKDINSNKYNILAIFGYITHFEGSRDKYAQVFSYTTRRWDLYHMLSATIVSILFGMLVTIIIRLKYLQALFLTGDYCRYLLGLEVNNFGTVFESITSCSVTAFLILLIIGLLKGREWVKRQYELVGSAIINKSTVCECTLRSIFPEESFEPEIKDSS